jgi:release factor glutamine methyltransferase
MTVAELVAFGARELRERGVPAPEWDAELLLRHVLGWDRASLLASADAAIAEAPEGAFRSLVARRAQRVPLQHLTGIQAFWKHEFRVTRDVLIPRPETELLVETALELLRGTERPVIVDVGTGSGCIALSLAAERPDARLHATDISAAALEVARGNAARLGLEGRVDFQLGQLLEPVAGLEGNLVLSNPPYVDPAERATLEPEVREHEPELALFPPGDTLCVYSRLVPSAFAWLRPGGFLAVEIAPSLASAVTGLFAAAGFEEVRLANDLAGRSRLVRGRRPPATAPVG